MATKYNVNTYQEQWTIPEEIQAKQVTGVGGTAIKAGNDTF